MLTPELNFQPDIAVRASSQPGEKRWEITFYAPSTVDYDVDGKQAVLRTLADDSLSLSIEQVSTADGGVLSYLVRVAAPGRSVDIGRIDVVSAELISQERELVRALRNSLQAAFIKALRDVQAVMPEVMMADAATPATSAVKKVYTPSGRWDLKKIFGWIKSMTGKRLAVSLAILLGVGLVVKGMLPNKSSDPLAIAMDEGGYKNMQAKIKKQISEAVASDRPSLGNLEGQTIAIDTMKAMGLDPGKANAGCLVGIK